MGIDQSQVSGFYAYGIYIPEDKNMEEDFWFGNFHENLETMNAAMNSGKLQAEKQKLH